jgi:hypothetical protein
MAIKLKHLLGEGISNLTLREKKKLLADLLEMKESFRGISLKSEGDGKESEVIVSNIPRNGDIDDNNIVRLDGVVQKAMPLHSLEKQAIENYVEIKPSPTKATNPHAIRYDTTDEFGHQNNTTTVIQKMQTGSEFNFVAFQRMINAGGDDGTPTSSTGTKLKVISTRTFISPDQGGDVLADLLQKLEL